jgi:hypothetical protein
MLLDDGAYSSFTRLYDQYYDNVVLLVPFENTFTDYSKTPKTLNIYGGVTISTAQKKHGNSSYYFDGRAGWENRIRIPPHSDFDFGTVDFTIEFYFLKQSNIEYSGVIGNGISPWSSGYFNIDPYGTSGSGAWGTNKTQMSLYNANSGAPWIVGTKGVSDTTDWHHIALTRNSNTFRLFLDGEMIGSGGFGGALNIGAGDGLHLNGGGSSNPTHGYMDSLRITKGIARYINNFTPPDSFF